MLADATGPQNSGSTAISPSSEEVILGRLKGALRVMVDWRAPAVSQDRKQSTVRFVLRSFCRHLERLMRFEEQGGYLTNVSEKRPCWQARVHKLREEHSRLRNRMDRLAPQLDDADAWQAERFEAVCVAIRELLDEVEDHDREEVALLQETLLCDVGGEG